MATRGFEALPGYVRVAQQRGRAVAAPCGQVAHHRVDRLLSAVALEQVEDGGVAILALARVQIQVEVANEAARVLAATRRLVHDEEAHLLVPAREGAGGHLGEGQAEQLLLHARNDRRLHGWR